MVAEPSVRRFLAPGCGPEQLAQLRAELGPDFAADWSAEVGRGDLVVLGRDTASMPFRSPFSACRLLKKEPRTVVFVVVDADDPYAAELARFCLADGVLREAADGRLLGLEEVGDHLERPARQVSVDALLEQAEARLAADPGASLSALQRIARAADEPDFLARLTDAETGLFDGPYAGIKIDEELKRALRFHQPLSLVLMDTGVAEWPRDDVARRAVLAELASVLLTECRDIDVLARFTPTVFLMLLPGTGPDGAVALSRRIAASLLERDYAADVRLSPAFGIVTVPAPGLRDRRSVLEQAERALATAAGGDERVVVAGS